MPVHARGVRAAPLWRPRSDWPRSGPQVYYYNKLRDNVLGKKDVLLEHHLAAFIGAGPLVGPALAARMGHRPGRILILPAGRGALPRWCLPARGARGAAFPPALRQRKAAAPPPT
ncbi:carbon starvation CstA family protein [Massilia jejuensis]|uniref:Carbon starvation CstA family protein n=1 Tax=Massilia jejuensis TaxID=648894 RepID=A0ABW0PH68_9BURK